MEVREYRDRVKLAAARLRYDYGMFAAMRRAMRKADRTSGDTQLFARDVVACLRDWQANGR